MSSRVEWLSEHVRIWAATAWAYAPAEVSSAVVMTSFACAPVIVYALGSPRIGYRGKLLALVAGFTGAWLCVRAGQPSSIFAFLEGYLYFGFLVPLVWALRPSVQAGSVTRPALALSAALVFVLLPALILPGAQNFGIQLRGWELMFAVYSYCVDGAGVSGEPRFRDCAFFLLVNPTLVYAQRARVVGAPRATWRGAARFGLGLVTLAAHSALFTMFYASGDPAPSLALSMSAAGYAAFMLYYLGRLVAGYWAHSGRASIDVGLIGMIGYTVPERYDFPLLARSPAQFWQRWNTYIGSWFRRYVFTPAAVSWQRRGVHPGVAKIAAVFATFLAAGLVHDYSVYLRFGTTAFGGSLVFLLNGFAVAAWAIISGVTRQRSTSSRWGRALDWAGALAGYGLFLHVLAFSVWLIIPAFGAGQLPAELSAVTGFFFR